MICKTAYQCFRHRFWLLIIVLLAVNANGDDKHPATTPNQETAINAGVFVQLFEWRWPDVALECERFLGPAGYAAVQISPPMEHVTGAEWWKRYQPVSYRLESRSGTRAEFSDMVKRCADAGVGIYADALTNHMANVGRGVGVAGSAYTEYRYPVPYDFDDFHHCDRYGDDVIRNYQDLWEVQNCQLNLLADLDTGKPAVQRKIASYLNDLLSLGVTGFRMDAAKHIPHDDIRDILELVDPDPFVFQEVIDRGGEPIDAGTYLINGSVTEFKFPIAMVAAIKLGNLDALANLSSQPGWLPADQAIVFVDNHDIQRGHAGAGDVLNYKDGQRYDLAVVFMLAYPYGYPMVMSSYAFDNSDQGPPDTSPHDDESGCGNAWVCEHRRDSIANMVKFRRQTAGMDIVNWTIAGNATLSFGRGNRGHVVININEQTVNVTIPTDMPAGQYCDLISGGASQGRCMGRSINVDEKGTIILSLKALEAVAILTNE